MQQRARLKYLDRFKKAWRRRRTSILVATDVAARGIDIKASTSWFTTRCPCRRMPTCTGRVEPVEPTPRGVGDARHPAERQRTERYSGTSTEKRRCRRSHGGERGGGRAARLCRA